MTPGRPEGERLFRVTHPFHPWYGRQFELFNYRHNWGEYRVWFFDEHDQLCVAARGLDGRRPARPGRRRRRRPCPLPGGRPAPGGVRCCGRWTGRRAEGQP